MEKAIRLLLLTALTIPCFASTVIVLWTPKATMVGADAKARRGNGEPTGATCKIGNISNDILWAEAGVRSADTVTDGIVFDFSSILTNELRSAVATGTRITQAEGKISQALSLILNSPSIKESAIANPDKYGVQFAIVMLDKGVTRLEVREFFPVKNTIGNIDISISRSRCPAGPKCGGSGSLAFGTHDHVDTEIRENPSLWNMPGGPRAIIRHLIGLEIQGHPDEVGPPITIAQIDSTGVHWINKGACQ